MAGFEIGIFGKGNGFTQGLCNPDTTLVNQDGQCVAAREVVVGEDEEGNDVTEWQENPYAPLPNEFSGFGVGGELEVTAAPAAWMEIGGRVRLGYSGSGVVNDACVEGNSPDSDRCTYQTDHPTVLKGSQKTVFGQLGVITHLYAKSFRISPFFAVGGEYSTWKAYTGDLDEVKDEGKLTSGTTTNFSLNPGLEVGVRMAGKSDTHQGLWLNLGVSDAIPLAQGFKLKGSDSGDIRPFNSLRDGAWSGLQVSLSANWHF